MSATFFGLKSKDVVKLADIHNLDNNPGVKFLDSGESQRHVTRFVTITVIIQLLLFVPKRIPIPGNLCKLNYCDCLHRKSQLMQIFFINL